jgi:hypothetical protein
MDDQPRYRTFVETPEYTPQFDGIQAKYGMDLLTRLLAATMNGIATKPTVYDCVLWDIRMAKTRSFRPEHPAFRIFFQIQNIDKEDEHILLCWIEEINAIDELTSYLM